MADEARVTNWAAVAAEEVFPGITRQTVDGERSTLVRYVYAPGSVYPRHSHPQEQITAVLRGRIAFEVGGEERTLGPGDVAVIPGGVPHGAAPVGSETVETLNVLSPRRTAEPVYEGGRTD